MKRFFEILLSCVLFVTTTTGTEVSITEAEADTFARIQLDGGKTTSLYRIDSSSTFSTWWPIYAEPGTRWIYFVDDVPQLQNQHFFRITESVPPTLEPHVSWKNAIQFPDDPFQLQLLPPIDFTDKPLGLVKFIILIDDLATVYYQDSKSYEYHYNYATDRIEQFSDLSASEFNQITLYNQGLQAILGNVIFAPNVNEYGIQFIAQDPIPRETIRFLYALVDATITKPVDSRGFYVPSYQQTITALSDEQWFADNNITITSTQKWEVGNSGYNEGWAIGKLVHVPGDEIEAAYENGTLSSNDILLTENLPAEVPYVQGIVTLTPASANSHVAILAEASGIPFGYVSDDSLKNEFLELVGREVILEVSNNYNSIASYLSVRAFPENFPEALRTEILSRKAIPDVEIQAIETLGAYASSVDALTPADINHFGGKAANFGSLRRGIPENSPEAIAFSFDLWLDFMNQEIGGIPLRTRIDNLLKLYSWPVNDLPQLKADLDTIRDLIKDETRFTEEQEMAVIAALSPFDSDRKIRIRSSTNVEDSQNFVGAGLYDSYSGCLLDDLDNDDLGPSKCDSSEGEERGVFRAIRKVYASFYNDNAFLERLRHNIDESQVGMALLAHHSFPDEIELANGVARAEYKNSQNYRQLNIYLTTQVGANSVTNPDAGKTPELIHCQVFSTNTYLYVNQRSNLLPLGESYVLDWESDYRSLANLLTQALDEYLTTDPDREEMVLDFEYKKTAPGGQLVVKQIREIPQSTSGQGLPWIMDNSRSSSYRIFQGEGGGDVFAIHRLKSRWNFTGTNRVLDEVGLSNSILSRVEWERINNDGEIVTNEGAPENWENASFEVGEDYAATSTITIDSWTQSTREDDTATVSLSATFPKVPLYYQSPLISAGKFSWTLKVEYQTPVIVLDQQSSARFGTSSEDYVRLEATPSDAIPFDAIPRHHTFATSDKTISFDIKHWWPNGPGPVNGYTAPLLQWDRTIITGLTTEPITLTGYYSQTYKPEHHNFGEWFLFEPALEENLSPQQRQELDNAGVHQFLMFTDSETSIWAIDAQGNVTEL